MCICKTYYHPQGYPGAEQVCVPSPAFGRLVHCKNRSSASCEIQEEEEALMWSWRSFQALGAM